MSSARAALDGSKKKDDGLGLKEISAYMATLDADAKKAIDELALGDRKGCTEMLKKAAEEKQRRGGGLNNKMALGCFHEPIRGIL
eukprot:gene3268-13972_t